MRVMVVHRDPETRNQIMIEAQTAGHRIHSAAADLDGVFTSIKMHGMPDVLLIDYHLDGPGHLGYAVIGAIKNHNPSAVVVLMSEKVLTEPPIAPDATIYYPINAADLVFTDFTEQVTKANRREASRTHGWD